MKFGNNKQVEWLLSRSYGQGGTVALPVFNEMREGDLPRVKGEFPAGVQDVLNRLTDQYIDWGNSPKTDIEWCFLVGGPGNGKSEALRSLSELLKIELPKRVPGNPSPRTIPEEWPIAPADIPEVSNLKIVFINDASIPRSGNIKTENGGSLFHDILDGMTYMLNHNDIGLALFGNINRGILIEEDALLRENNYFEHDNDKRRGAQFIRWLTNPPCRVS